MKTRKIKKSVKILIAAITIIIFLTSFEANIISESFPRNDLHLNKVRSDGVQIKNWSGRTMAIDEDVINDIAVGDIDPDFEGDETIVVGRSEKVTLITGSYNCWNTQTIYTDTWEITAVAIGDVDPAHPGNELVIVGMSCWVTVIYKNNGQWIGERIFRDYDFILDVAIGDIDPVHEGNEILIGGDSCRIVMLYKTGNNWSSEILLHDLSANSYNAIAIGEFDESNSFTEAVILDTAFRVTELTKLNNSWNIQPIWSDRTFLYDVAIGDFYSNHPETELVIVGESQNVTMIFGNSTYWNVTNIWKDKAALRDVAIGDFDPTHDGNELIVVGLSNKVSNKATLLKENDTNWEVQTLWIDSNYLISVGIGEFDSLHNHNEIAVATYSGKVFNLEFENFEFLLAPIQQNQTVTAGNNISFPVLILPNWGFDGHVELELDDSFLNSELDYQINPKKLTLPGICYINISTSVSLAPGEYNFTIVGSSGNIIHSSNLTLIVTQKLTVGFSNRIFKSKYLNRIRL